MNKHGRSIRMFLKDGSVTGLRHVELYNWTGQAVACPRSQMTKLRDFVDELPGSSNTGVYFLFGQLDGANAVYVGESENALERISAHLREKDWWHETVIFTNKDHNLTKAHVRYLESKIVQAVKAANRYVCDNGNTPGTPSLPSAERAPMDEFMDYMKLILGVLGYRVLEPLADSQRIREIAPTGSSTIASTALQYEPEPEDTLYLLTTTSGVNARGIQTDEGFVVLKGSLAVLNHTPSLPETYKKARKTLIESGKIVEHDGLLRFAEDVLCNSPSYAGAVVTGTSISGPKNWKTSAGKTYGEIQDEIANAMILDHEDEFNSDASANYSREDMTGEIVASLVSTVENVQ